MLNSTYTAMLAALESSHPSETVIRCIENIRCIGTDTHCRHRNFGRCHQGPGCELLAIARRQASCRPAGPAGQTTVEFAFIIPLFLLLMLGVVQMVIIGGAALAVNQAAISCARYASLNPSASPATVASFLTTTVSPLINDSGLRPLSLSPGAVPRTTGSALTVTVTYNLQNKLFLGSSFFGISFPAQVSASQTMASE
jgi:TadE-like protein